MEQDYIDRAQQQWQRIEPGLDTRSAGIVGRIGRLAQLIEARADRMLDGLGVTRAEFEVLSLLIRTARPMTPGEISTSVLCSAAGTTKRLKKLAASGLITRETNPADGRGALITMTEEGNARVMPVLHAILEFERDILQVLASDAQESLTGQLRTLLHSLETGR